jgi:hypothetical protein
MEQLFFVSRWTKLLAFAYCKQGRTKKELLLFLSLSKYSWNYNTTID